MPIKSNREYRAAMSPFTMPETTGESDDKTLILRGEPIIFNSPTVMYESDDGTKYYEVIQRGALDGTDLTDFIFNYNHGGRVYARFKNKSIVYSITDHAMSVEIHLDAEDEGHKQLYRDIKSGRIDGMSFAFRVAEDAYNRETRTRTITKIKKLYDISAVDIPAYSSTSIQARSEQGGEFAEFVMAQERRRALALYAKTFTL